MKTQISRDTFDKEKRYSGLYQQQGRMLTDADWNELARILKERLDQVTRDVVASGAPRDGALSIDDNRRIVPGDIYVDGIRAEILGDQPLEASGQPDLPGSPVLSASGPYFVYADVWERPVTSLEDPSLRDPGLHGADTCTRTQTMLQVKTCPEDIDPEAQIPGMGDAPLSLRIRTSVASADPCDPCAGLVEAGEGRVGNYLFRVEIHDIQGDPDNPERLVIKWSSENGAEQYEALPSSQMPPGFITDSHIYEFFDLKSEKHIGLHYNAEFSPIRGLLSDSYEIPEGEDDPKIYVRRWDGYCSLTRTGSNWSLSALPGKEKGQSLTTSPATPDATGAVSIASEMEINLESLVLGIALTGQVFVPGDFWLAAVRESVHELGDVLLSEAPPTGIMHHYLRLAHVDGGGTVTRHENTARRRKHNFPPLTDIRASDVGYAVESCESGLFTSAHDTVKKALDQICDITADHVAFSPGCDTGIYQGADVETIADALKLLCEIPASQVSYTPPGDCAALSGDGVQTVQEAIDILCARPTGGGCLHTVGENGQFSSLKQALEKLVAEDVKDICICLLPGDHVLAPGISIDAPAPDVHVTITGCGNATRVHLKSEPMIFKRFASITFKDYKVLGQGAMPGMVVFDDVIDVFLENFDISGITEESPLMAVQGVGSLAMEKSTIEALTSKSMNQIRQLFDGIPFLEQLFAQIEPRKFNERLDKTSSQIERLPRANRDELSKEIQNHLEGTTGNIRFSLRMAVVQFYKTIRREKSSAQNIAAALLQIKRQAVLSVPGTALAITTAATHCEIHGNLILGKTILYGVTEAVPKDNLLRFLQSAMQENQVRFEPTPAHLRFTNNVVSNIALSELAVRRLQNLAESSGGTLDEIFQNITISQNTIAIAENNFLSHHAKIQGNTFEVQSEKTGANIAETAIYTANHANIKTTLLNITAESQQSANLRLTIS